LTTLDHHGPGYRAAQMGRLSAASAVLALVLLTAAAVLLIADGPGYVPTTVVLPVNVEFRGVGLAVGLAAAALLATTFLVIAGLETASAMQVLARTRRATSQLPSRVLPLRRTLLAPLALRGIDVEHVPEVPSIALPGAAELSAVVRLRCTVLIPAHNEEAVLGITLDSLEAQTRRPDRVLVVADNCSDSTVELARSRGVEVVETAGNTEKKAGALNQQLARLLPTAEIADVVLVMDADSTITPDFLEVALALLEEDQDLIAVGGLFYGEEGGGLIGQFQRNEYTRYQRIVARRLNRVFVLTGTASVIRSYALRAVAEARGTLIPGTSGQVYDTLALTEDNELTVALKTLGARMTSPPQCRVTTEVMPRWRDLWRQRLRWHRGALENIGIYGPTRATAMYWTQQIALAYGVVALWSYLLLMTVTLLAADRVLWSPFWITIGIIFVVERVVTAWAGGWRARLLAAPIVPELAYAMFLQLCFVTSIVQIATGRKAGWNYVPRNTANGLLLVPFGILLPASILAADWYHALAIWVGFNTLVFAFLSLLQLLPPLQLASRWHRLTQH
jgi:cellulose synthase/poly-beta-1,6-N-acetylglucosamine synthase-like glycosyltransferase